MTNDTDYVTPSASAIELPKQMRLEGGDIGLRSFRGIWCDESENNGPNLTQVGRLLILLGLVKSREEEVEKLGRKEPGISQGGGHTDIGQVTGDGIFGLSLVIQALWPDSDRTPSQLRDEIQWLVFEGFEALKDEADQSKLMDKLLFFVGKGEDSEDEEE